MCALALDGCDAALWRCAKENHVWGDCTLWGGDKSLKEPPLASAVCIILGIRGGLGPLGISSPFCTTVGSGITLCLVGQRVSWGPKLVKVNSTGLSLPFCPSSQFSYDLRFHP